MVFIALHVHVHAHAHAHAYARAHAQKYTNLDADIQAHTYNLDVVVVKSMVFLELHGGPVCLDRVGYLFVPLCVWLHYVAVCCNV